MTDGRRLLIISPVRNEAAHLELVAAALVAQTRPPDAWIVVDDGSTDATPDLLRRLAAQVPFMSALSTPLGYTRDRGDRHAVAAAPRAFNWALATTDSASWTHIGKLDGDIELPPEYFERLLEEFQRDCALGIGGGVLVEQVGGEWRAMRTARHHVRGALKLYRRECFEAIGGVEERLGWDGLDQSYARMRGWRTACFDHLVARHHRPVGTADGALRGRLRGGETHYVLGFSLPWVMLKSVRYASSRPPVLSGLAFLYGYLRAAARPSVSRAGDREYRRFVRRDELRRLRGATLVRGGSPNGRGSMPSNTRSV
jgi:glycosyltransferase involved in cell wall biosynthesis